MTITHQPSEFINDPTLAFKTSLVKPANRSPKMMLSPIIVDGKKINVLLIGQAVTNGIIENAEYGTHSFALKLDHEEDLEALENLTSLFEPLKTTIENFDTFTFKPYVKDDQLWIKCKYTKNKSNYQFTSDPQLKMNPKRPAEANLSAYSTDLEVVGELKGYVNYEDSTYGFSFNVLTINLV